MRFLLACLLGIYLCSAVYAAESVNVTMVETGRITNYFDEYWVVNVDGVITLTNPTDRDLYDISLRYDVLSLSVVETGGTSYFQDGQFILGRLPANSSVSATYNIVGITVDDPTLINKGVLYTGITKYNPVIYSDTFGQLQKANLEDASYTGRNGRLISVELLNPTGFEFTINSMRVIKTSTLDVNTPLAEWLLVNESAPLTIDPDTIFVRDILDRDSAEGQIYWLSVDVFITRVSFYDQSNISRYTEENLTLPPELLNYTINESNDTNRSFATITELHAKKLADRRVVTADSPVEISVIVNNFAARLFTFTITDALPPGFVFKGGDGWTERDGVLSYTGTVSGKNAVVASYYADLVDKDTAGLDYFSASQVDYLVDTVAKTIYSDNVPFIRNFLPHPDLYVQKKLRYLDDDEVSVTVTVQNLGASPVEGLLLREYLEDGDVFSQISEIPAEKGLWDIKEIKNGESWEVTYLTTQDTNLNILPGLYGVPSSSVLKSIVLENVISSAWEVVRMATLEILGILLLIGLPVAYFVFKRRHPLELPKQ